MFWSLKLQGDVPANFFSQTSFLYVARSTTYEGSPADSLEHGESGSGFDAILGYEFDLFQFGLMTRGIGGATKDESKSYSRLSSGLMIGKKWIENNLDLKLALSYASQMEQKIGEAKTESSGAEFIVKIGYIYRLSSRMHFLYGAGFSWMKTAGASAQENSAYLVSSASQQSMTKELSFGLSFKMD